LHWTWHPDLIHKPSVLHSHTPQIGQHTADQTLKAKLGRDRGTELRAQSRTKIRVGLGRRLEDALISMLPSCLGFFSTL
jgi:hypothetical protein